MNNQRYSRSGASRGGRSMPDRDEEGRFMSDNQRNYGRSSYQGNQGGYRGRSQNDQQAYYQGYNDEGYSSRDNRHGGWFGDSEGHSQAARRGWDERQGGNRSGRYEDEFSDENYDRPQSYGSGSNYQNFDEEEDDHYSRGARNRNQSNRSRSQQHSGHGGWFGDSEGHSQAARRGWEDRR